jgi:hypothetical protein
MPSQISQWRENDALIRVVVQNTTRTSFRDVFISATLTRDGQPIAQTNDGHPSQPRLAIGPGETRSFSWREIISESALDYDRSVAQQVLTTGELPEGSYQLCLRALSAQRQPLSQQQCGSFQIILADPPVLLAPIRGALVSPTPLLQWTPSSPSVPGLVYRLTVKVRYAGQTPAQAMASNPVRIQHDVSTTSYQVPVTEQLLPDPLDPNYAGHVWQVQALYNGRPYGRNRGLSQIEWFVCVPNPGDTTYRSNEVKGYDATSRKPDTVRVPVLSWTVPYPELLTGRPVKLTGTVPAEDTLLYSLHLQMPERIGPDLVAVLVGKGSPSTEPLQVNGMKYRGGYFVYREPPKYRGGFFVYGAPSDTGKGGREPIPIEIVPLELRTYGTPSDTGAGGSVQRRYNYSGYYVYRLPSDTTQPAPLDTIVYYNSVASQIRRDTCCVDCIGLTGQTTIETRPEVSVGGTFVPLMLGLHLTLPKMIKARCSLVIRCVCGGPSVLAIHRSCWQWVPSTGMGCASSGLGSGRCLQGHRLKLTYFLYSLLAQGIRLFRWVQFPQPCLCSVSLTAMMNVVLPELCGIDELRLLILLEGRVRERANELLLGLLFLLIYPDNPQELVGLEGKSSEHYLFLR